MKTIKGDLIKLAKEGSFDYIIHGCNCFNVMGAGIAYQIALQFPIAYTADQQTRVGDMSKLGGFTLSPAIREFNGCHFYVVNLYTQYQPGKNFDLKALEFGLYKLNKLIPSVRRIGFPLIGCGIGGGKWEDVKKVINKQLKGHKITIVELK